MSRIDNTKFYKSALKKHGHTSQGVHWNSDDSQHIRFQVLLDFVEDIETASIVDAGCGFGDLFCFMPTKPLSYCGLDVMEEMVIEARERTGCEIFHKDVLTDSLPRADYYFCSGAMNILTHFETHLFIRRCFEMSEKGFIFNLLLGEDDSLVYNYMQVQEIEAIAKTLDAQADFKTGYLPRDVSVYLKK